MKGTGPHPYCFRSFSPSVLAALASIEMMPFALIGTYLPAVDLLRIFPSDEYRFRAGSRTGPTPLRYASVTNTWLRHGRSHLAAVCLSGTGHMTVLANARKRKQRSLGLLFSEVFPLATTREIPKCLSIHRSVRFALQGAVGLTIN